MKNCPQCGRPNRDGARFCEGCGTDIGNVQPAPEPASAPREAKPISEETKKTLRYVIIAVVLIVLAGGGYTAWRYFTRVPTALDISQKYMDFVKATNYVEAYQLIKPDLKLDKGVYIYSMKKLDDQKGTVKEYQIESDANNIQNFLPTSNSNESTYESIPVKIGRNQPESDQLILINIGTSDKPDWRIDLSNQTRQCTLNLPKIPKLEVKVCDNSVDVNSSGSVSITCFRDISVPVKLGGPNVVSQTIDFPNEDGSDINLEVSSNLQKELEKVIAGYNQAYIQATQDCNVEHFEPYLVRDCDKWQELQDDLDSPNYATEPTIYALQSVEYEKGRFSSDYDEPTVQIDDTEEWTTQVEESEEQNSEQWTYELQVQDDGSWKISDYYQ